MGKLPSQFERQFFLLSQLTSILAAKRAKPRAEMMTQRRGSPQTEAVLPSETVRQASVYFATLDDGRSVPLAGRNGLEPPGLLEEACRAGQFPVWLRDDCSTVRPGLV